MSINKIRSILYSVAKYMGDLQALLKSKKSGRADPIIKRIMRRIYGKISGRMMNKF